jgi:hypothetical protein
MYRSSQLPDARHPVGLRHGASAALAPWTPVRRMGEGGGGGAILAPDSRWRGWGGRSGGPRLRSAVFPVSRRRLGGGGRRRGRRPRNAYNQGPWGTGVTVTWGSPKPLLEVRFLGPPLRFRPRNPSKSLGFSGFQGSRRNSAGSRSKRPEPGKNCNQNCNRLRLPDPASVVGRNPLAGLPGSRSVGV